MTVELTDQYLKMARDLAGLGSSGRDALTRYEEACFILMRTRIQRLTHALTGQPPPDLEVAHEGLRNAARAILTLAPDLASATTRLAVTDPSDPRVLTTFYGLVQSEFNR